MLPTLLQLRLVSKPDPPTGTVPRAGIRVIDGDTKAFPFRVKWPTMLSIRNFCTAGITRSREDGTALVDPFPKPRYRTIFTPLWVGLCAAGRALGVFFYVSAILTVPVLLLLIAGIVDVADRAKWVPVAFFLLAFPVLGLLAVVVMKRNDDVL